MAIANAVARAGSIRAVARADIGGGPFELLAPADDPFLLAVDEVGLVYLSQRLDGQRLHLVPRRP